ncbi:MAG: thiosulfate oxidation carrier complex protein SoxZ [Alphaproteobacteria bacterium]|nr:thiosulfate oxidation carrier complex protein SoxZ [Alphaproteobacteria bacterium]
MARVLINLPQRAKRGDIMEIKTLIQHPMETGYRLDNEGVAIPRDIINRFTCTYNGDEVFQAELFPAISANPFLAFSTVATESGELVFSWTDDRGQTQTETRQITVE